MVYAGSHVRTDIRRNLLRNRLFHQGRRNCLHDSATAVLDFRYKVRLIIIATVDDRTHCIDLLDHGQCVTLSKSRTCKLCLPHGFTGMNNATSLIWKINACSGTKIKSTLSLEEIIFSHPGCDLHHTIVAGIRNNIRKRLSSMCIRPYRTFDKCGSPLCTKGLSSITDKIICLGYRSHLKSRTHNDRFNN